MFRGLGDAVALGLGFYSLELIFVLGPSDTLTQECYWGGQGRIEEDRVIIFILSAEILAIQPAFPVGSQKSGSQPLPSWQQAEKAY